MSAHNHSMAGITGRDDYIVTKALAYAITAIDNLPEHLREGSDADNMRDLLASRCSTEAERVHVLNGARAHMNLPMLPTKAGTLFQFPGRPRS